MIRDVAVYLSPAATADAGMHYAISLAGIFGAHVVGVAFAFEPVIPASVMGGISADLIEAQRSENEAVAKDAVERFAQAAQSAGVSSERRLVNATLAGAAETFAQISRRFDIAVVSQAERDKIAAEELVAETALFNSGRPVVMVPHNHKGGVKLDRSVVCWDGSRAAARAIGDAMPLLQRAGNVDILVVATDKAQRNATPGAGLREHLVRHGLQAEIRRVPGADVDVPRAILSYVADHSVDLVVMGGYGHSRLREFILGGVTRSMLQAMTVPTLMSH